ncbi:hypothetical protein DSJ_07435 [Pantoea stewartii subsp. stewartii DC283]|uniref:Uncharacterized protein n=1 Tax=Pantoea stewartii subsp. stewartii DC283 TaxID=660596 RepID=A0ABM6K4M9_PANSE|nr:hypothetical protein DSJ_07435 [Pantoea stewartii subsp. stewartii DC283]
MNGPSGICYTLKVKSRFVRITVFMREERRVGVGVGVGHIFIAEQITAYPGAFARMAAFYLPLLSRVIVNAWEEIA